MTTLNELTTAQLEAIGRGIGQILLEEFNRNGVMYAIRTVVGDAYRLERLLKESVSDAVRKGERHGR